MIVVAAVIVGRGWSFWPGNSTGTTSVAGETTEVRAVIGSEKRDFFEDPEAYS